jgi:hypothetical protein
MLVDECLVCSVSVSSEQHKQMQGGREKVNKQILTLGYCEPGIAGV